MTDERNEEVAEAAAEEEVDLDSAEGLRAAFEKEKQKAEQFYGSWQRAAADYQNYKRRMEEERSELGRLASAALIINLLPLMDDIERALDEVDTKLAGLTWIDGIRLIHRKFEMVLENAGVSAIEADAQAFDPTVHEAISEADGEDGKIVSVVQKGYKLGDRVLRPAMVVVGNGSGVAKEQAEQEEPPASEGDTQTDITG